MIFYTEDTGVIINIVVCLIALCAIGFSLYFMAARSGLGWPAIFTRFGICFAIQMISLVLAAGLTISEALFLDAVNKSMSWYYSNWLLIGLYFCPMFFGMAILPAVYLEKTKRVCDLKILEKNLKLFNKNGFFFCSFKGSIEFGFPHTIVYAFPLFVFDNSNLSFDRHGHTYLIYVHVSCTVRYKRIGY